MGKHAARAEDERQDQAYYAGQQDAMAATAQQGAMAPGAGAGGLTAEDTERLTELGKLRDQGILTDEEFAREKAKILGTG